MYQLLMSLLRTLDDAIFGTFKRQYETMLEREVIPSCRTVLDVGCGTTSPIRFFSKKLERSVGVDGFLPAIEESREAGIHNDYVCMNVLEIADYFAPGSFDCVLASDLIEHLEKDDGLKLMRSMETIARKKVIIFTPNGFQPQGAYGGNEYQIHRSGWEIEEMRRFGYRVTGINGWKPLRGEIAAPRFSPKPLWARISFLTQPLTTHNPRHAFQIMCVKDL